MLEFGRKDYLIPDRCTEVGGLKRLSQSDRPMKRPAAHGDVVEPAEPPRKKSRRERMYQNLDLSFSQQFDVGFGFEVANFSFSSLCVKGA